MDLELKLAFHPWRCLCLGSLLQITYSLPLRRTTEQPSQNFLTDDRTFIPLCCCSIDLNTGDDFEYPVVGRRGDDEGGVLRDVDVAVVLSRADEKDDEEEEQNRTCAVAAAAVRLEREIGRAHV